ncbi:MAG: tRNA (adenosine(37)-N6)-threonylcarbamoyltransferase complex dimerization subunit type 1 TsaB [Pseudomonadota bacterium]
MYQNILAFDTSAAHCAVGLLWDGVMVVDRVEPMQKGQGEALLPLIGAALAGRDRTRLQAIAVGIGPGNFTGTRIGVATARGLSLSLGIPAIGISNFELLYHPDATSDGVHQRALSAPRDSIYVQEFDGLTAISDPVKTSGAAPSAPEDIPNRLIAYAQIKPSVTRPAPLYVRPPDAALPVEPPVTLLP